MRGPAPARKPPRAAFAWRKTHFATRSAFPFVPIRPWQRRWKRLRARSPGPTPTPISWISRAEPQIDLRRLRSARHQLLSRALADHYYEGRADMRRKIAVIGSLLRRNTPDMPTAALEKFVLSPTPQGQHKFATILSQEAKQLLAMDRYERRALSRRKPFEPSMRRADGSRDCSN
jgi:hypothetical protein